MCLLIFDVITFSLFIPSTVVTLFEVSVEIFKQKKEIQEINSSAYGVT